MLEVDLEELRKITEIIDINDVVKWETQPHITALYGIHEDVDINDIYSVVNQRNMYEYKITGINFFDTDKYDVLKFKIESFHMNRLNLRLSKRIAHTNEYPEYIPHITIAYLKKGTGKKYEIKFDKPYSFRSNRFHLSMPPNFHYYYSNGVFERKETIIEAKGNKDAKNVYYITVPNSTEESKKEFSKLKGVNFNIIDATTMRYDSDRDVIEDAHGVLIKLNSESIKNNLFFVRTNLKYYTRAYKSMMILEKRGFIICNPLRVHSLCNHKYESMELLKSHGLPVPKQTLITKTVYDDTDLNKLIDLAGGKFPLIVKVTNGSKGVCVNKVGDETELIKVLEDYFYLDLDVQLLLQEMIESDGDYRIHVVRSIRDCKIIAAMHRKSTNKKDVRNNYSAGGEVSDLKNIPEEMVNLALKAVEKIEGNWIGVDIIGNKGNYKILELNSSSGVMGINKATGKNIAQLVVDYFFDPEIHAKPENIIAGYIENVEIDGENYPCKLDTGNGVSASSIHGEILEDNGKTLKWKDALGKVHKSEIVGEANREKGKEVKTFKKILLPVTLANRSVEKQPFIVTDRLDKTTPVLINRGLLRKLGMIIDSADIFKISNRIELKNWNKFIENK